MIDTPLNQGNHLVVVVVVGELLLPCASQSADSLRPCLNFICFSFHSPSVFPMPLPLPFLFFFFFSYFLLFAFDIVSCGVVFSWSTPRPALPSFSTRYRRSTAVSLRYRCRS